MGMSWGEKAEIKEELREELATERATVKATARELAEREAAYDSKWKVKEAQQATREAVFEAQKEALRQTTAIENSTKAAEDSLAAKSREVDNMQVSIDKEDITRRESELQKRLDEKDLTNEANLTVIRAEERAAGVKMNSELSQQLARAEANSLSKDSIIAHQKETIELLNETLKVTMGKLTQVDLKGITIHVEAAKPAVKPDGKQEQKTN